MRMWKAQESGHYLNHKNTDAWETFVHLSAAASANHNNSEEEGKLIHRYLQQVERGLPM